VSIETVMLDFGNVLMFHDNALLFRTLAARAGREPAQVAKVVESEDWTRANRGELDSEGIRRWICSELGCDIPRREFFALWSCHFRVHTAVLPIVERLSQRAKLVLLSNTNALHVEYFRPRMPILARFHALVLSNEVGKVKPEPEFYEEALRRAGTAPERTAFFDDVQGYVDAASALGIHGRLFTTAEKFEASLRELGIS
jgi:glucose-1-phosphatase